MSLLVVGTVAFDTVETPLARREMIIGGAATYISLAASYLADNIQLVSIVGEDFPQAEMDYMESRDISLEGLKIVEGKESFFWEGRYHSNMNQRDTITTDLNVLADFDPVLPTSYQDAEYVMLGNLTPEIQMKVINQMTKKPKLIVLDTMNFWMDTALASLKAVIKEVDVLVINDEETRQLSGEYSLVKAAKVIQEEHDVKYLVVKKGEHGALLFHEGKIFFAPALPLAEVNDPTGAGDTFAGGLIGYIASTGDISFESMKRAIIYGSAMASFCVEDFSIDRLKTLDPDQIEKRLDQFVQLVNFDLVLDQV